jgi:hypothetical protein
MKMTREVKWRKVFSILLSLMVTLASGFCLNQNVVGELPDVRFVSGPWVGVSYWGFVLPWVSQIVYPGAQKQVLWANFAADVVVWFVAAYLVLAALKLPKLGAARRARPRRKKK